MAEIDGMSLIDSSATAACGAAFTLSASSPASAIERVNGAWEVEVRQGSRWVVARGGSASTYDMARDRAIVMTSALLDWLCVKGVADLRIIEATDSHIVWWAAVDGSVLRLKSIGTLTVTLGAPTLVVKDAQGNVVPPAPPLPLMRHESFTYFRQAQLTDDLFDAFRNICLAIESILSSVVPPNLRETERDWLERALCTVHQQGVKLDPFAQPGDPYPVVTVSSELRDARNAVFHAKSNRDHFMPQKWSDRTSVLESLKRMARLYLRLMEAHLGFTPPSSFLFASGAEYLTRRLDQAVIHVTDDPAPFDPGQESINPSGGRVAPLLTRRAPEFEQSFLKCFLGRAPVTQLSALTHVARVVATAEDVPVIAWIPDSRLTLEGFDWFECEMGIRIKNRQQPRQDYPA